MSVINAFGGVAVAAATALEEAKASPELNWLDQRLAEIPQTDFPVTHRFTPGLYIREIFMPKGSILTSKIHRTMHPFVISKGKVSVWSEKEGEVLLEAPHTGITTPGTRRALYIHEDTIWTTFHPTDETDPDVIEEQIIEKHFKPELAFPKARDLALAEAGL